MQVKLLAGGEIFRKEAVKIAERTEGVISASESGGVISVEIIELADESEVITAIVNKIKEDLHVKAEPFLGDLTTGNTKINRSDIDMYKSKRIRADLKIVKSLTILSIVNECILTFFFVIFYGEISTSVVFNIISEVSSGLIWCIMSNKVYSKYNESRYVLDKQNADDAEKSDKAAEPDYKIDMHWLIVAAVLCIISLSATIFAILFSGSFYSGSTFGLMLTILGFLIGAILRINHERVHSPAHIAEKTKIRTEKLEQKELKKAIAENEKDTEICNKCLSVCGARFFVKYWRQLLNTAMADVNVTESYGYEEKIARLTAAKNLIDLGLLHFTMNYIKISYPDLLNEDEFCANMEAYDSYTNKG